MHSRPKIWRQPEMLRICTAGSLFWKGLRQISHLSSGAETSVKPWSRKSSNEERGGLIWRGDMLCDESGEVGVKETLLGSKR